MVEKLWMSLSLVALVRAGARFEKSRLVERPAEPAREAAA
jgi:hypothetical protein